MRTKIVSVTPGLVHLHVIPFHKKCPSHESLAAGAADHNRMKSNLSSVSVCSKRCALKFLQTLSLCPTGSQTCVNNPPTHALGTFRKQYQGKGLREGGGRVGSGLRRQLTRRPLLSSRCRSRFKRPGGTARWDDPLKYSVHAMFTYSVSCTSFQPSVCACIQVYT